MTRPEQELEWAENDLRIAAQNLNDAQRRLEDAEDEFNECMEDVHKWRVAIKEAGGEFRVPSGELAWRTIETRYSAASADLCMLCGRPSGEHAATGPFMDDHWCPEPDGPNRGFSATRIFTPRQGV